MTTKNCILILILLILVAMLLSSRGSSSVEGGWGLIAAPMALIFGGAREPKNRDNNKGNNKGDNRGNNKGKVKFEPVAGDRSGLKPSGEITISGKSTFPAAAADDLVAAINTYNTFEPINDEEKKKLEKAVAVVNKQHSTKFSIEDAIAVRDIVVSQRISNIIGKVIEASAEINTQFAAGKSPLEIAKAMKFPPVSVVKQILLAQNAGDMKKVNDMMHNPEQLPEGFAKHLEAAAAVDHGGRPNMTKILDAAQVYENKLAKILKKDKNIAFKTEVQLKEEQTKDPRFGRPVATPDFFFPNPIMLNGKLVNWIDSKNYPLFTSAKLTEGDHLPGILKGLNRQAIKYNKNFGRGAFVFAGGIQEGLSLSTKQGEVDVDLIDGSAL